MEYYRLIKYSLISFIAFGLLSCNHTDGLIEQNIRKAGDNKKELIKIRNCFEESSPKRLASLFLLKYSGNKGVLDSFNRFHPDVENIKSDFITTDLNNAFAIWEKSKWKKKVSFDIFCKYILPYRVGNEKVENWRKYFYDRYSHLSSRSTTISSHAKLIAQDLNSWYSYNNDYYPIVQTQSLSDILKFKSGNCGDIANTFIYAFRANGIPAAKEYVPFWGRFNGTHAEAVFYNDSNNFTPLDPYVFTYNAAKVYRSSYSSIEYEAEKIKQLGVNDKNIPPLFFAINGIDVTSKRTSVSNIVVCLNKVHEQKVAYICVFNLGQWKPISWGKIAPNKTVKFDQMGRNILYQAAYYKNDSLDLIGQPFILEISGKIKTFSDSPIITKSLKIYRSGISNAMDRGYRILPDKAYRLLVLKNNSWVDLGVKKMNQGDPYLEYTNVPSNALFRVIKVDGNNTERIFSYENDKQCWY